MIEVLVVDDDVAHRLMVRRALLKVSHGATVTEAESLTTGCATFDSGGFSLVIVDLNLAGQSGLELIRHVRASPDGGATPLIVISTSTLESDVHAAYAAGANTFIFKSSTGADFARDLVKAVDFVTR